MNDKREKICVIICNAIIAFSTMFFATSGILNGAGDGQVGKHVIGWGYFKAYTMDSNIFMGIVALLVLGWTVRDWLRKEDTLPKWMETLYLTGTTCLVLTFLITATFLAPTRELRGEGYFSMFQDEMLFYHLLNPVLSVICFTCLQKKYTFAPRESFKGTIPTILYATIYFIMVVIVKCWEDFYNFTFGGRYYVIPLVAAVVYGVVYGISRLLILLHNR